jgi:hypothetical protein
MGAELVYRSQGRSRSEETGADGRTPARRVGRIVEQLGCGSVEKGGASHARPRGGELPGAEREEESAESGEERGDVGAKRARDPGDD